MGMANGNGNGTGRAVISSLITAVVVILLTLISTGQLFTSAGDMAQAEALKTEVAARIRNDDKIASRVDGVEANLMHRLERIEAKLDAIAEKQNRTTP